MVLGLPCQLDYHNITFAFQRTFGHLLPRRLQNRDLVDRPQGRNDCPPISPGGYNASFNQIGRIQTREQEQSTRGKVSAGDAFPDELPSPTTTTSSMKKSNSQRSSLNGGKKEVRWDGGVVGGDEDDRVPEGPDGRGIASQAV
ncbi:hypothetical protein Dda_6873 [Drechslerella dactyloides]|uniref:Uncharacterized protein n=1 Tax=Drechslerella dactyloides TaxID=74499 RepID=A0AAD6NHT4_DREDA|nr:hypothetical protein Dda_6873 [Drechslerella dactyloides]